MPFLSYPYETFIAPVLPGLLLAYAVFLGVCVALDWMAPSQRRRRGDASAPALIALLLLFARGQFAPGSRAALALVLAAHAVAVYALARFAPRAGDAPGGPAWAAVIVIALSSWLKCVDLDAWPPNLNEYAAHTGLYGLYAMGGDWPAEIWRGKEYCLVNGGVSPLMLPITWASMRLFGGTVFAVRFSEVVGSTALLVFFWLWIRRHLSGWWAPLALAVFAFSPWHLAQSRMGTFLSISAALALAILWIADGLGRAPEPPMRRWIGLGVATGLIGWAYAPLKVLYAFFLAVVAAKGFELRQARVRAWWAGPAIALGLAASFVLVQLGGIAHFGEMFRYDFGFLATDTSIFHKTPGGEVTPAIQGPAVVAENFLANARLWFGGTYAEPTILSWYAPALTLTALAAAAALLRGGSLATPLYFLVGMLPPLLIFPLERRSLIAWPLVYAAGVAFARELEANASALLPQRWWRVACRAACLGALALASLHGLHLFATTNSVVLARPYFGPDYRIEMLRDAERLLPSHFLYFLNLDSMAVPVVDLQLFEPARRLDRRGQWEFIDLENLEQHLDDMPDDQPIAFLYLAEEGEDSIMDELRTRLPGGSVVRHLADDGSGEVHYSVYLYDRRRLGGAEE